MHVPMIPAPGVSSFSAASSKERTCVFELITGETGNQASSGFELVAGQLETT
jgi:hypothetical protein